MELTKKERHKIYKKALEYLKARFIAMNNHDVGMYWAICRNLTSFQRKKYSPYIYPDYYPEIQEAKIASYGIYSSYFFPLDEEGLTQRIMVLERAIELTK